MEARIKKYQERDKIIKKGMLGRTTEEEGDLKYVLHCWLNMSEEEKKHLWSSGISTLEYYDLTPRNEHIDDDKNYISFAAACAEDGGRCTVNNPGLLREKEIELHENIRKIFKIISKMSSFTIEEEYTFDPSKQS